VRFDLVVFDLDGTLVDTLPDIAGALNGALATRGAEPIDVAVVRSLVGEGVVNLAAKALALRPLPGTDAASLARDIVATYREKPCVASRTYDGIPETLAGLRAAGCRLAVLTNKPGLVARMLLEALGLAARFDEGAVIGDGDGFARKPDPEAVRALLGRWSVEPARMLMVGDGLPDLAVARAAGCKVAAATWGYTDRTRLEMEKPDFVVEAPGEVLRLVS
jgi:phosphoglycolate phosphatase